MTLSSEALALARRLEAFQLRQLRLLARLESEAEETVALTAGREMVKEILAHAWGDQPLRNRDLRDMQRLADDIDREFLPILQDLESRLPEKAERRARRQKPVFAGFAKLGLLPPGVRGAGRRLREEQTALGDRAPEGDDGLGRPGICGEWRDTRCARSGRPGAPEPAGKPRRSAGPRGRSARRKSCS